MKKTAFPYSLMLIVLIFSFFYFTFLAHAAAQNKKDTSKKQIAASLMQKAKKALLSGNPKLAENYWKQASSLDPNNIKPLWLNPNASKTYYKRNQDKVLEEKKFVQLLYEMPYEKAKIELDKKLLSNPDNAKLRAVYLNLAELNNDKQEADLHRSLLGIKPELKQESKLKFWLKTLLIIIVISLIIFEVISIYKTTKKNNSPLPSNIKSL